MFIQNISKESLKLSVTSHKETRHDSIVKARRMWSGGGEVELETQFCTGDTQKHTVFNYVSK